MIAPTFLAPDEAQRYNEETTDPFRFAVCGEPMTLPDLLDAVMEGPEHTDYVTYVEGRTHDKVVFIFACECFGARSYNLHCFARERETGALINRDLARQDAAMMIVATLLDLGNLGVKAENAWFRCPLDMKFPISRKRPS